MGKKRKAANKVKKVRIDNEKKKLLKKSDAGSYYNQDDRLEKYAEGGLYKWSSDESNDNKVTLKMTLKQRQDIRALSQSFRLMCCKRCSKHLSFAKLVADSSKL